MAESYEHGVAMWDILYRLQRRYAERDDLHFGINSFIYYAEGEPGRRVAPDVYAVFGVPPRPRAERKSYRLWEEGVPPAIVFEVTSPKTRKADLTAKREIYAAMGVREYILFDPEGAYLHPPLRGFVLTGDSYTEIEPGADGSLVSDVLGVRLVPADQLLAMIDLETGERCLTDHEAEQQRADQAEAELRALRAQLDALRGNGHGTNGAPNA